MKSEKHDNCGIKHEAWPGFKALFWSVFALCALYLGYILYAGASRH
jgi:ABC-type uncharacterized transport system permease subunit